MNDAGTAVPPPRAGGAPAAEEPPAASHYLRRVKAQQADRAPLAEREALLREAIHAHPAERTFLGRWMGLRPGLDSTESLTALQEEAPTLIPAVVAALLRRPGFEAAAARFAGPAEAWLATPPAQALARVWDAHAEGRAIGAEDAAAAADRDLAPFFAPFFALKAARRRVIRGDRQTAAERAELAALGIDAAAMAAHLKGFLRLDPPWATALAAAAFTSEGARTTVSVREGFCGYQEAAVRDGTLAFRDPFTGADCHPVDSCLLFGRSCYLFRGRHPFYLIAAGAGSKALCLYVPRHELVIDFRAALSKFLGAELWSNLLVLLAQRLIRNVPAHDAAMARPAVPAARRRVIVCMQQAQNFAHHVWNFYTGLERVVRAGLEDRVESVLFGGSEFFGPIEAIYPEFAGRVEQLARGPVVDPCPFGTEALLLTVGGYFIPASLRDRLRAAMRRLPPREGAASPETWIPPGEAPWPVVWIGMRTGDKSWVGQEDGIRHLIDGIAARHPGALFLLDGFSFPVGRDEISQEWLGAMELLRDLAERIRLASAVPERVVNMVGNSLRESVLWAERTDAYLAPVGTTQHKIGWFTGAPGLVYSPPRGRQIRAEDRLPGSWEAEGSSLPRYLIGRPVAPGERRGSGDRRDHLDNMALDADEILAAMTAMLGERAAAATAPADAPGPGR